MFFNRSRLNRCLLSPWADGFWPVQLLWLWYIIILVHIYILLIRLWSFDHYIISSYPGTSLGIKNSSHELSQAVQAADQAMELSKGLGKPQASVLAMLFYLETKGQPESWRCLKHPLWICGCRVFQRNVIMVFVCVLRIVPKIRSNFTKKYCKPPTEPWKYLPPLKLFQHGGPSKKLMIWWCFIFPELISPATITDSNYNYSQPIISSNMSGELDAIVWLMLHSMG